jgi:hypothetical protein
MAKKKAEPQEEAPKTEPKIAHDIQTHVSDNVTTIWATCSCGFETAAYTIEGDGAKAVRAATDEAQKHLWNPEPQKLSGEEEPAVEEPRG